MIEFFKKLFRIGVKANEKKDKYLALKEAVENLLDNKFDDNGPWIKVKKVDIVRIIEILKDD